MQNEPYMQMEHESGVVARWHGGEYISLGYVQEMGEAGIDGDAFHAYDVLNVWDYAAGQPRIARTLDAFAEAVNEGIAARGADEVQS
jgi:hypothetical protein